MAALDAGADDFVVAPIRASELVARVQMALRRVVTRARSRWGRVEIDRAERKAFLRGNELALTARESETPSDPKKERPAATVDQLLGLWSFLEPRLAAAPRFTSARLQRIRQMLYRLRLDDEDFDLLFSVMSELARPAASRRASKG